jgi:membrane carboxypeptidase/penicillin-binding protein
MNWRAVKRQKKRQTSGGLMALRFVLLASFIAMAGFIGSLLLGAGAAFAMYSSYAQELPSADEIGRASVETFETTRLYDRTGQHVLYELIPSDVDKGRRTWVSLDEIPLHLREATIAMEDKTFYTNIGGINWEGLARAARGVILDEYAGGGSSITMQLVRNVIMTYEQRAEQSYLRKIREAVLSIELTRRFPGKEGRDQMLEWYLNNIFYGYSAYGIEAAAQVYFGKSASELTLAESAMLVPLGQSPAINPFDRPEDAKRRQEVVLDQLYLQGYIDADEAWQAKQEPFVIAPPENAPQAPHYVWYVRDRLVKEYGADVVYGGGLQVITSIDLEVQAEAERLANEHVASIIDKYGTNNAAVVVINNQTSEIVAMVGSLDYYDRNIDGQVNMALAELQPGSSFKPFTYATAFDQGYTAAQMVMDVRTAFPDPPSTLPYVPENYSRNYHGPILLRRALGNSYNIPAVAVMNLVGPEAVARTARAMGIESLNAASYNLSLGLGGAEVRLIDMTYGFSVFANKGVMLGTSKLPGEYREGYRALDPIVIRQVFDSKGQEIFRLVEPERQPVLRPQVAYLITSILSDNAARSQAFGPNSPMVLPDRPVAAKTGTTNDFIDGWTMGYTPQYTVGVWVGVMEHDSAGRSIRGRMKVSPDVGSPDGVRVAAPIWHNIMVYLHQDLPVEQFVQPDGMVTAVVDATSGKLPTGNSPSTLTELFIEGTVPTEKDDVHHAIRVVKSSGKLAGPQTPEEDVETRVYAFFPPDADDWVRENNIPRPPTEFDERFGPHGTNTDVAIVRPRLFQVVSGAVPITGNARAGGQERYWVEYGVGMNPGSWARIGGDHGEHIENGVLETWNTGGLEGIYTVRLNVVDAGQLRQSSVTVMVDNVPPRISLELSTPYRILVKQQLEPTYVLQEEDLVYKVGEDEWININVEALDNTQMSHVVFMINGTPIGQSTVAPYSFRWDLKRGIPSSVSYRFDLAAPVDRVDGDTTIHEEVRPDGDGVLYERTETRGDQVSLTQVRRDAAGNVTYRIESPSGVIDWRPVPSGEGAQISAIAYDAAGNRASTESKSVQITR